jgi:hypothetical protein
MDTFVDSSVESLATAPIDGIGGHYADRLGGWGGAATEVATAGVSGGVGQTVEDARSDEDDVSWGSSLSGAEKGAGAEALKLAAKGAAKGH